MNDTITRFIRALEDSVMLAPYRDETPDDYQARQIRAARRAVGLREISVSFFGNIVDNKL